MFYLFHGAGIIFLLSKGMWFESYDSITINSWYCFLKFSASYQNGVSPCYDKKIKKLKLKKFSNLECKF